MGSSKTYFNPWMPGNPKMDLFLKKKLMMQANNNILCLCHVECVHRLLMVGRWGSTTRQHGATQVKVNFSMGHRHTFDIGSNFVDHLIRLCIWDCINDYRVETSIIEHPQVSKHQKSSKDNLLIVRHVSKQCLVANCSMIS